MKEYVGGFLIGLGIAILLHVYQDKKTDDTWEVVTDNG